MRAATIVVPRATQLSHVAWSPTPVKDLPRVLVVHLVEVVEIDPPAGETSVRWFLLTDQPIDTPEQMLRVVDRYLRRWVVEEFFSDKWTMPTTSSA